MGREIEHSYGFWKFPSSGEETEMEETEAPAEEVESTPETKAISETETTLEMESIPETEAAGAGESGSASAWLWFAGAGFLMLLGILIFVLCFRRQKKQKGEERGEAAENLRPRPAYPQNGAAVMSVPVSVALVGNLQHIGEREEQQDSFAISDFADPAVSRQKGCLAVVADGMGGMKNGGRISAMVTASLLGKFEERQFPDDIPLELLQWAQEANEEVLQHLGSHVGESGSTLVAAWVKDGRLHYLSVGDSRICLLRSGTLTVLNREHVYGSELDERAARGEISLEEARSDPQRHALTSYIGSNPLQKIDRSLYGFPLLAGDKILLMSDGVFGTLSDMEILAEAEYEAPAMAEALLGRVLSHRKPEQDNFTAVILQCR
ncbi:MAG: serine/threonine-protein phosphatase [Lachnospiraceae bacterium]|nr:serine/threonine-protein phosphatase [Lachnospiraceae bacterium]